jgi:hypothetical protein
MRHLMLATSLGLAVVSFATAHAQTPAPADSASAQPSCHRCLDGFRFLPSSVINDVFAGTSFQNATGGGMAVNLNVPVRNVEGETLGTLNGDIGFFLLDFEYQYSLAPWLALHAGVSGIGRIGTTIESLVASGVSAAFGGSFGAIVPFWRGPTFQVSAVGDVRRNTQYDVDPFGFAQQVADSGYSPDAKYILLASEQVNRWSLGLRAAWAIAPWIGVVGVIEPGGASASTSGDGSLTTIGTSVGIDFGKLSRVPVGVSLAYRNQSGSGKTGNISGGYRTGEFGLFYTGRSEFTIGGDFFWSRIAVESESVPDLDAVQFRLVTRIDF